MTDYFSYTVQRIDYKHAGTLTLQGAINDASFDSFEHAQLIVQKRKTSMFYTYHLRWLDTQTWEATVDFSDQEFSKGTWDYYLWSDEGEKHRLKIEDASFFDWDRTSIIKNGGATYELSCYVTTKSSLSSKIYTPSVNLSNFQAQRTGSYTTRLEGAFEASEFIHKESLSKAAVIIKARDTEQSFYETLVVSETSHERFSVALELDFTKILPDTYENKRWDLYLQIRQYNDDYLFRLQLPETVHPEKNTYVDLNSTNLFQVYFYKTINHNLSIALAALDIKRDVVSYSIKDGHIHFEGFAYFNLFNPKRLSELSSSFIIRKRHSEKQCTFSASIQEIGQTSPNGQTYAGFKAAIPLKKIFTLQEAEWAVYDFYVQFEVGAKVYELSLGCKQYDYYVDAPLADDTTVHRLKGMRSFLLFTPGGKFKLEIYAYSPDKLFYLTYRQAPDRKKKEEKDVWLIGERPDTAQDTGYHFFKYCREHYPQKKIYYVINKDSPDRERVEKLGNVITFGSLKHFKVAAQANKFIGSHDLEYILPTKAIDWQNYQESERVFLQHGVLGRKKVDYFKQYYQYPFTLFCVSSKPEFNLVTKKMGYNPDEVRITGLSRFDYLNHHQHKTEHSILIIPTWRDWIKEKEFTASDYFKRYKALLSDSRFIDMLERHNVTLDFYVHYRMQPFIEHFQELASERINIIQFGERSVQELLIKNALLVTDYSSVSFDFNYMAKPVVFYHFDFDRFFKNGILRPADETFLGDICKDEKGLIDAVESYIINNFAEKASVKRQKDSIFTYIDDQNNARIYNSINANK